MELNEWFQKGLTPAEYINSMETHKANLKHIYEHFTLPDDADFFRKLKENRLRSVVITEDWCGDAMLNVPILLRVAEEAEMPVRMILRDNNLELMDQYLTNGTSRSIPIFIFINEKGEEVTTWGPRAPKIQQFSDDKKSELPETDAEYYKQKSRELIDFMSQTFRDEPSFWNNVYSSLKNTLQRVI